MAAEEFFTALAELSVHVGTKLIGQAVQTREIDHTKLLNQIVIIAGKQTVEILQELSGLTNLTRDEFTQVACIVAREHKSFAEVLMGVRFDLDKELTINIMETWDPHYQRLQRTTHRSQFKE